MAASKHPFQRTKFSKENLISSSNPAHTTHRTPKNLPKDKSTVEVRLDAKKIICKTCKISEKLPEIPLNYYTGGDKNHVANEELRKAINKFKANHIHS